MQVQSKKDLLNDLGLALLLLIQYFLLNLLTTFHRWVPEYQFKLIFIPSLESIAIFLLLFLVSHGGQRAKKVTAFFVGLPVTVYIVYSFGEALVQHAYRRSFIPWTDLGFIRGVIHLLLKRPPFARPIIYVPAFGLFILFLYIIFSLFLRLVMGTFNLAKRRVLTPSIIFSILAVTGLAAGFNQFLIDDIFTQLRPPEDIELASAPEQSNTSVLDRREPSEHPFLRLRDRDVLLFIIESYGYTAYSKPKLFNNLEPFFLEREDMLRESGYHIFSHFLGSPVIGGWSWLADATLLTGIWIDSQQKYEALMQSNAQSVPKLFQEAGYNTLLAAPGTVHGPWEEVRLFYGFDEDMLGSDYTYKGPGFSFVPVTDQFAIHTVHNKRLREDEKTPSFIEYILVSSHGPFNRIPPYIENWEKMGDGSIYNELPIQYFDNDWYTGREYDEGYGAAIRYVLKVITEYLVQFIDDETLVVIVGDHQPKFPITERGSPLSVPVHAISRDRLLLESLVGYGYVESLIPSQNPPHPGMETFYQTFIETINGSSP
jgi:hypothetical protein